ncbi:hypothetical protein [Burkholderia multivorans]|uniref:hypothetical protein n=1 Tax=Burkholderia multivorans TaxID=87883 RepID=UPI00143E4A40|nr:hypothetical protein [Burkholderia multivorans]QIX18785.1 hypothetical protein FOB32_25060 [Burkholderia multivorans]
MADQFDGTAEQVLARLMERVGAKARVSLERIKAACDRIEAMRGLMNYSRVAAVTIELFGGPRAQTIQNNQYLKAYIATRIAEYHKTRPTEATRSPKVQAVSTTRRYPTDDLDSKTKLYLDLLKQDNERLHKENGRLAQLLEQNSLRHPYSLAEAFGRGPADDLTLDLLPQHSNALIPKCVLDALAVVLHKQPALVHIQRRGHSVRLAFESDGIIQTLLSPAQWNEAVRWIDAQRQE